MLEKIHCDSFQPKMHLNVTDDSSFGEQIKTERIFGQLNVSCGSPGIEPIHFFVNSYSFE